MIKISKDNINHMAEDRSAKPKIKNWYSNRYQIVIIQRNILLFFTMISMISVAIAVLFVKSIVSSKSLEPYIIQVEEKTGMATVVKQMTGENFTNSEVIRRYFINSFVQAASGYDPATYKIDVNKVRLFATPSVYSDFRRRINARELGNESSIEVRIKSIQFSDNNNVMIRTFRKSSNRSGQNQEKDEVIQMTFNFADMDLTMEERMVNPLGFQVSKYTISEEAFKY